jgi:sulfite exporter TauE/SafE
MLGLLAGSLGLGIDRAGVLAGISNAAAAVAGGVMVLWGLRTILALRGVTMGGFHAPRALQRAAGRIMGGVRGKGPIARAGLTGLASGLLPCGWLYVFVAAAAATASPVSAALLMAFFWLGTLPVLVALGLGAQRLTGRLGRHVPLVTAAVVVLLGLMTITARVNAPAMNARDLEPRHAPHAGR